MKCLIPAVGPSLWLSLLLFGGNDAHSQPSNDLFAQRVVLPALPPTLKGDTHGATAESGEPSYGYLFPVHTVWWSWTAPSNGFVRLVDDGILMSIDSAIYTGNSLPELLLAPISQTLSLWQVEAGRTYHIVADTGLEQEFELQFVYFVSPLNDSFTNRVSLPDPPFSRVDNLSVPTLENGEPHLPSRASFNIWFTWTAPVAGRLRLFTTSDNYAFDVFVGDALASLTSVPVQHSSTNYSSHEYSCSVEAGVAYQIAFGRLGGGYPHIHEQYSAIPWQAVLDTIPANGTFESRTLLAGSSGDFVANGYLIPGSLLWYEWIAPANGTLLPGVAKAYAGGNLSQLMPLQNAASGIAVTQTMSIKLSVLAPSPTRVIWQFHPLPANDSFARAEIFTGSSVELAGQNYGARREAREPNHGAEFAGRTIWYRWTAPTNGWATWYVTTPGYTPSTRVYEGTSLSRLKRVANRSQIVSPEALFILHEFQAVAGRTYCFVVDNQRTPAEEGAGYYVNPPGTFDMAFTFTTLKLKVELAAAVGAPPLLTAGFVAPDPDVVSDVSVSQYGLISLDRFCPTMTVAGAEPGGLLRWTNPPPGRYLLYSVVSNHSGGTAVLSPVNLVIPPPNDDLANAELVEGFEFSQLGAIAGAGREPREPSHGDAKGLGSVWWKWTAPADGYVEIGLTVYGDRYGYEPSSSTGITPSLAVYRVRNDKLVRIAGARRARYTVGCRLQAEEGVTYFIAGQIPKGYYLSDCGGNAELRLRLAAAKVASSIAGKTFKHRLPIHLEVEPNFPLDEIDHVEFVEAQEPGRPPRVLAGTNVSPFRVVWTGVAKGPHKVAARVYRKDGQSFTTDFADLFVQTANDNFADALVLTGVAPTIQDDVGYSSREPGEPRETGPPYGDSVWYRWTAPNSGKWMLRIIGFGEAVYFYTGSSLPTLQPVSVQRNQGATLYWFNTTSGTTYHIAVKRNHPFPVPYDLSMLPADAPANDSFANPTALSLGATQAIGTLRFATSQPGEPGNENASVWYTWTAPTNGVVAIKHYQGYRRTRIFAGATLPSLQELPDLADPGVLFWAERWNCYRVEANQTYRLQISAPLAYGDYLDPYWDLNANQFNIEMIFEPVPGNDAFATPFELPPGSSILRGRGLGASSEPLDLMGGSATAVTRWWTWQAPVNGTLWITFSNTYVQAFHGDSLDSLTSVPGSILGFSISVTNGESLRLCALHDHQWVDLFEVQFNFQEAAIAREAAAAVSSAFRPANEDRVVVDSAPAVLALQLRAVSAAGAEIIVQGPGGTVFKIQTSTDLEAWQDLPTGVNAIATNGESRFGITLSDSPRCFFRVRVVE